MQFVVHALPVDAPARRGGNLSNSCTQFSLKTVIQLLKEAGVELPADASASASGKPYGGGVTLTKEENLKWKTRMKKQCPSAKTTHG